ncbi:hypothetical protein FG05_30074 [Fusarium graminearum]|nr:hypothetical protein FG05_30074 [Fusarium graminearum]
MSSSVSQTSPSVGGTQARTGSDPVFDKAMAKFKKHLTKDQAAKFANCTVDDVRNEIKIIQNRHGSQRRLRNMERISKFVEGMVQLGQVVEVFLNLDNIVALIWGPLKFILLTASTCLDTLDTLLDVYGQIGEVLPDLTRYHQIYKEYHSVHKHLEDYYCDILQFHSNALDVFARPGWKTLFHSTWKTFKTQFGPILKSLERHRVMLSEEKLTAIMQETQKQGKSIHDKLHQMDSALRERDKKDAERDLITRQSQIDQQHRTVERKIDAPKYHEDYEIASQKRSQNTSGQWILGHPLVSEWLDHSSTADGKIYLSGIPGAGKTVLTSCLITHLKELKSSTTDSGDRFTISYFYFKHDQPKKNSFVSLLLSLLAQLVAQDESLLDHIYHACHSMDSQQFRSLDEVSRHVSIALQSQTRCFIIIDALDECPEAPKVLQWFENVIFKENGTLGDIDSNIRLFISGQRDGILERHDQDIKEYSEAMASKIRDKFSLDLEYEQDIVSCVTSHACGMFLYAQIVLTNLISQTSKYDFKQEMKAETFPDGLEQAYERVIVRVLRNPNKSERAVAKHILGMIICAFRPLHWREIQSKFCIDPSNSEADIDRELVLSCKQICSSLVDFSYVDPSLSSPGEEIIDLVHSSAKTYLVQTKEIDVPTENAKMALFCTEYMISRPLTPGLSRPDIQEYATTGYYGFHDYAAAFWWKHARQVLAASELDTGLTQRVLQAAHHCVVETGQLEGIESLYDSAEGIQSLKTKLEGLPQNLRDWNIIKLYEMRVVAIRQSIADLINQPYERKGPALVLYGPLRYKCRKPWCRSFSRGFEAEQQQQSHINQHELPFTCDHQGCFATDVGFEKETDLKTHYRRWHPQEEHSLFPAPQQHRKRHTAIQKAIRRGNLDTVKALIGQGNINAKRGISFLKTAVRNGHLHIVQYLTELEANDTMLIWGDDGDTSALDAAVKRADLEIVTFLCGLDRTTVINETLHKCVKVVPFPKSIMSMLLSACAPDVFQHILHFAIRSRNATATAYFAETFDVSTFHGALELAVEAAHLPCLDALLLSGKTDPNTRNLKGDLPLHVACESGAIPIIQRLYSVTTTTDIKGASGNTPLHLAAKGGHYEAVEFLVERGAYINAMNESFQTPLKLAKQNGHEAVQRLLLENGADINAIDTLFSELGKLLEGDVHKEVQRRILDNSLNIKSTKVLFKVLSKLAEKKGQEVVQRPVLENGAELDSVKTSLGP